MAVELRTRKCSKEFCNGVVKIIALDENYAVFMCKDCGKIYPYVIDSSVKYD